MTRLRCLDCQDGRHCRHAGYIPAGMILAPCRCLDCDPLPIQARLFSHALVENDLGGCVDCGQPACKLLIGGAGQPDTSLCARCEYRRYLQATGGRDYANEQRVRWGLEPIPRPDLDPPAPKRERPSSAGAAARGAERPTRVLGTIRPDPGSRWRARRPPVEHLAVQVAGVGGRGRTS